MNGKLHEAVIGTIDQVIEISRTDEALRTRLRVIADELLALTELAEAIEQATTHDPETVPEEPTPSSPASQRDVDPGTRNPLPTINVASALMACPPGGGLEEVSHVAGLVGRLRLKAEAARWAAERRRLLANNADHELEVAPHDRALYTKAKEVGCYLWMSDPKRGQIADPAGYDLIADCFDTLVRAVEAADFFLGRRDASADEVKRALTLLAEAQSALRCAVSRSSRIKDQDQQLVFGAVRKIAEQRGVYIATGLKYDAPIDPSGWAGINGAVHALRASFDEREQKERRTAKFLSNLKYKTTELASSTAPEPDAWKGLVPLVDDLVSLGVQPSRIEIRETLLPVLDLLPTQVEGSKAFASVVREIGKYRESLAAPARPESPVTALSPEVQRVASLLAGKSLLMIGGDERPEARLALERAFGLSRLDWIRTAEHESFHNFEPYVARPDVAAVLLLIRWASHSFGELKCVCDRHRKPLVRLPGGYNPNQVAAAILSQASRRLDPSPR